MPRAVGLDDLQRQVGCPQRLLDASPVCATARVTRSGVEDGEPRFRAAAQLAHRTGGTQCSSTKVCCARNCVARDLRTRFEHRAELVTCVDALLPVCDAQLRGHRFLLPPVRRVAAAGRLDRLLQAADLARARRFCGARLAIQRFECDHAFPVLEPREHVGTLGKLRRRGRRCRGTAAGRGFRGARRGVDVHALEGDAGGRLIARKVQRAVVVVPLVDRGRLRTAGGEQQEQE